MAAPQEIPLAQALMRLGLSWQQGYRRVLTGELSGRQLPNGRWMVAEKSIVALERVRDTAKTATAGPAAS